MKSSSKLMTALLAGTALTLPTMAYAAIDELVVTAQKREQSAQDIGVSLTAFSGDDVSNMSMNVAKDLAFQTPGLSATNGVAGGAPLFAIRGIGLADYNPSATGGVGLYNDEVFASSGVFFQGEMFDVDRIEVLKGPQGTLYGRNTTGGAIKVISNKPTDEFEASLKARYGRYNSVGVEGVVNGPMGDKAQARLAINYLKDGDGWQTDALSGQDYGKEDKLAVRGLVALQPSDTFDLLIDVHASRDEGISPLALLQGDDREHPIETYVPQRDEEGVGASITANWELGIGTLTSITAYDEYEYATVEGFDGMPGTLGEIGSDMEFSQFNQEIRLTSDDSGRVSWIVGANYSIEESDGSNFVFFEDFMNYLSLPPTVPGLFGASIVDSQVDSKITSYGIFAHTETEITEKLELVAGIRYTHDEVEFVSDVLDFSRTAVDMGLYLSATSLSGITDWAPIGPLFNFSASSTALFAALSNSIFPAGDSVRLGGTGRAGDTDNGEAEEDDISGKIGLNFRPNDDVLLYASYSRGYKGGRYYIGAVPNNQHLFYVEPETLDAYEVGFKSTLADGTVQLNGSAFWYDYENYQSIINTTLNTILLGNIPEAEISGAELEMLWAPVDGLNIGLGVGFLDTEVTKAPTTADLNGISSRGGILGQELPQSPEWTYNAVVAYDFAVANGLYANAQVSYAYADQQNTLLGDPGAVIDSRHNVTARVGLGPEEGSWEIALWGANLTDEDGSTYSQSNVIGLPTAQYTKPRTYGVEVNLKF